MHLTNLLDRMQPTQWIEYNTGSIFKRSMADLNSKFSFSKTSCCIKAKESSLPNYLLIAGERWRFMPFTRTLSWNEMSIAMFSLLCTFSIIVTVMPQVPSEWRCVWGKVLYGTCVCLCVWRLKEDWKFVGNIHIVIYWPSTEPSIKRFTCVN